MEKQAINIYLYIDKSQMDFELQICNVIFCDKM